MGDSERNEHIVRLVKRGLVQFERGDIEAAMELWRDALKLDPNNRAAQDYLASVRDQSFSGARRRGLRAVADGASGTGLRAVRTADEEDTPRTLDGVVPDLQPSSGGGTPDVEIQAALRAYKSGDLDRAYDILEKVNKREPDRLDVEGYLAMLRTKRSKVWVKTIGDQGRILRVSISPQKLRELRLTPDEGFILSQIDGHLSVDDLLSLHTNRVRVLEVLARFVRDRIVE